MTPASAPFTMTVPSHVVAQKRAELLRNGVGLYGRKTGIRIKKYVLKDLDGLDNIDDFFSNELENVHVGRIQREFPLVETASEDSGTSSAREGLSTILGFSSIASPEEEEEEEVEKTGKQLAEEAKAKSKVGKKKGLTFRRRKEEDEGLETAFPEEQESPVPASERVTTPHTAMKSAAAKGSVGRPSSARKLSSAKKSPLSRRVSFGKVEDPFETRDKIRRSPAKGKGREQQSPSFTSDVSEIEMDGNDSLLDTSVQEPFPDPGQPDSDLDDEGAPYSEMEDEYAPPEQEPQSEEEEVSKESFREDEEEEEEEEEAVIPRRRGRGKKKSKFMTSTKTTKKTTTKKATTTRKRKADDDDDSGSPKKKGKKMTQKEMVEAERRRISMSRFEPPTPPQNARRSGRRRIPPLAWWKNEKVEYGYKEGDDEYMPHPVSVLKDTKRTPKKRSSK
tara:strand:+ start:3593 stop:4936 length:1344 start_codon:yes stop_codon:yes gene_type:complete